MRSSRYLSATVVAAAVLTAVVGPTPAQAAPPTAAPGPKPLVAEEADFNGDGYADLAVAAPNAMVGGVKKSGLVSIAYGSATGLRYDKQQLVSRTSPGVPSTGLDCCGWGYAASYGDLDADGYDDVILAGSAGTPLVLWGGPSGISGGAVIREADRANTIAAGDVNGDGKADLVIAGRDTGPEKEHWGLRIQYGPLDRATGKPASSVFRNTQAADRVAVDGVQVDDMTGDGIADIVASGTSTKTSEGYRGFVLKGTHGGLVKGGTLDGPPQRPARRHQRRRLPGGRRRSRLHVRRRHARRDLGHVRRPGGRQQDPARPAHRPEHPPGSREPTRSATSGAPTWPSATSTGTVTRTSSSAPRGRRSGRAPGAPAPSPCCAAAGRASPRPARRSSPRAPRGYRAPPRPATTSAKPSPSRTATPTAGRKCTSAAPARTAGSAGSGSSPPRRRASPARGRRRSTSAAATEPPTSAPSSPSSSHPRRPGPDPSRIRAPERRLLPGRLRSGLRDGGAGPSSSDLAGLAHGVITGIRGASCARIARCRRWADLHRVAGGPGVTHAGQDRWQPMNNIKRVLAAVALTGAALAATGTAHADGSYGTGSTSGHTLGNANVQASADFQASQANIYGNSGVTGSGASSGASSEYSGTDVGNNVGVLTNPYGTSGTSSNGGSSVGKG